MQVCIFEFRGVKLLWTGFKQNNRIHVFDIPVGEGTVLLLFSFAYPFILAEQEIGRVAGTPLTGEEVAELLDFNICDTVILQFDHDIGNKQRGFRTDPGGIIRKHLQDLYLLVKN